MNPMTNVKNTQKLNQTELDLGLIGSKSSWHNDFKDSAWIFVGGLPYDLTEGDIICVFSQYGEIVNINLVRDKATGKSKGFCFICYEDQRSTILSVDNLNSIKLLGRTLRVNHVADYKMPKEHENDDEVTRALRETGCAPTIQEKSEDEKEIVPIKKAKKEKKKKKDKKKKKKKKEERKSSDSEEDSDQVSSPEASKYRGRVKVKQERSDSGCGKNDGYRSYEEPSGSRNIKPWLSNREESRSPSSREYERNRYHEEREQYKNGDSRKDQQQLMKHYDDRSNQERYEKSKREHHDEGDRGCYDKKFDNFYEKPAQGRYDKNNTHYDDREHNDPRRQSDYSDRTGRKYDSDFDKDNSKSQSSRDHVQSYKKQESPPREQRKDYSRGERRRSRSRDRYRSRSPRDRK